jgi:cytochrome c oxidase subunit 2
MAMAVALVVVVLGSLLFHYFSPWWSTPLASNWKQMDETLTITLAITTVFFILINLFVAYALVKYRHRKTGQRAAWQPDNRRLERWLIGITTVGIIAMLAPGLFVYAEYITPPRDAMAVEVVGQQWQWRFRFPGESGKLGASDARFVTANNPFGLDPDDPAGQDNVLVDANELHLPLNKPVKILLRSLDVLHDFYVPEFRARMNMVPGMVTSFWFTPTRAGRYEILCAQLCGVGHFNMRGVVVVDEPATYQAWLKQQPTFAMAKTKPASTTVVAGTSSADKGKALAQSKGCIACHSVDGSKGVGPSWKGVFGKQHAMESGSTVAADEAYLKRSILEPQAEVVKGYPPVMPKMPMSEDEVAALVAYIKTLKE